MTLGYVLGAAAIFYELPSSGFVARALLGARDWIDRGQPSPPPDQVAPATSHSAIDRPEHTFDGFTLYARGPDRQGIATQAWLINMRGEVVHRWAIAFSRSFPDQSHLRIRQPDSLVCFFDCHLLPNGDLLAVLHGRTVPAGCGLIRLDKDSALLWAYPGLVHHDLDVADDGTIYALEEELVSDMPKGFQTIATSQLSDRVVVLSGDGKPLRSISLLAAFRDSPYAAYLATLEKAAGKWTIPQGSTAPHVDHQQIRSDPLHPNSVRVLRPELASQFPQFKAGHLLISLRNISVIALLDPERETIVWATRGAWYAQHDAQFLNNGHLLIFDNLGSPVGSRILEYDPKSNGFPWSYGGEGATPFFTSERGMCQRLPNGNTLFLSTEGGDVIEVTVDKKVVWSCSLGGYVTTARRYSADQVPFIGRGPRE